MPEVTKRKSGVRYGPFNNEIPVVVKSCSCGAYTEVYADQEVLCKGCNKEMFNYTDYHVQAEGSMNQIIAAIWVRMGSDATEEEATRAYEFVKELPEGHQEYIGTYLNNLVHYVAKHLDYDAVLSKL